MNTLLLATAIGLGLLTTLLTAAEGALLSLTRADREALQGDTRRTARALNSLFAAPKQYLFTLQVSGELALVGTTLSLAKLTIDSYGLEVGWLALAVAPPLLLIVCLLFPRAIAARYPNQIAHFVALPLQGLHYASLPLMWPLKRLSELLMDVMGIAAPGSHKLEESEFRTLVDIGEKEGTLREQERELIHNVFEFGDMTVADVMTPRTEIEGFPVNMPVERMLETIKDQRYARVPIYKSNLDNILGILYTKDLLTFRLRGEAGRKTLKELLHPVYFVPITKKLDELFREFQTQKIHMAVVVDEYGGVSGLVTMDDLLAELFGVMLDEHDVEEAEIVELPDNHWRVQAHMDLEQFAELMEIDLPDEEEASTVGGFVLSLFGALPNEGESITYGPLEFQVEALQGTRLLTLLVHRMVEPSETTVGTGEEV